MTTKHCDSCAQGALGRRTVSRRNFCDAESLAKRYGKTNFHPASRLEKLLEGLLGSLGGFERKFPEGGLDFLEVALVWKFPHGILAKQTSKKFASEPPKLLRSPSRSGSMQKLVGALSYTVKHATKMGINALRSLGRSCDSNRTIAGGGDVIEIRIAANHEPQTMIQEDMSGKNATVWNFGRTQDKKVRMA